MASFTETRAGVQGRAPHPPSAPASLGPSQPVASPSWVWEQESALPASGRGLGRGQLGPSGSLSSKCCLPFTHGDGHTPAPTVSAL